MTTLATRFSALGALPRPGSRIVDGALPILVLALWASPLRAQGDELHPSSHRVHEVGVEPSVSLEVLEWGGEGPPLIFLAGANMNAHYFDAFAPRFTDRFRVLAITRRGHGASSRPDAGYQLERLVDDIVAVLDSLAIDRALLAGHSLAGDELTALAGTHPDRVAGLIYLDAGHDHRTFPRCSLEDPPGADTVEGLTERVFAGRPVGEWVVRSQMRVGEDGRVQGPRASPDAVRRILAGLPAPEYDAVEAPVLAVYVVPRAIGGMVEGFGVPSEECRRTAQRYIYGGIADLVRGVERAKVVALQETTHHMVLVTPDLVEDAIRGWLRELEEGN